MATSGSLPTSSGNFKLNFSHFRLISGHFRSTSGLLLAIFGSFPVIFCSFLVTFVKLLTFSYPERKFWMDRSLEGVKNLTKLAFEPSITNKVSSCWEGHGWKATRKWHSFPRVEIVSFILALKIWQNYLRTLNHQQGLQVLEATRK